MAALLCSACAADVLEAATDTGGFATTLQPDGTGDPTDSGSIDAGSASSDGSATDSESGAETGAGTSGTTGTTGATTGADGICVDMADAGKPCPGSDGNFCTSRCDAAGTCTDGQPVQCGAPDVCGVMTCEPTTGECLELPTADTTIVCRAAVGPCDVEETCDGTTTACPADAFAAAGTTCGAPADPGNPCDAADVCDGSSATCPDTAMADGTACGTSCSGRYDVIERQCMGGSCMDTATVTESCAYCQSEVCDLGACVDAGIDPCDDGFGCSSAACNEAANVCVQDYASCGLNLGGSNSARVLDTVTLTLDAGQPGLAGELLCTLTGSQCVDPLWDFETPGWAGFATATGADCTTPLTGDVSHADCHNRDGANPDTQSVLLLDPDGGVMGAGINNLDMSAYANLRLHMFAALSDQQEANGASADSLEVRTCCGMDCNPVTDPGSVALGDLVQDAPLGSWLEYPCPGLTCGAGYAIPTDNCPALGIGFLYSVTATDEYAYIDDLRFAISVVDARLALMDQGDGTYTMDVQGCAISDVDVQCEWADGSSTEAHTVAFSAP